MKQEVDRPGPCPHCGGKSDGTIMYSSPLQASCRDCGENWEFGEGIKVISLVDGMAKRPGMYFRRELKPAEIAVLRRVTQVLNDGEKAMYSDLLGEFMRSRP